MAVVRRTESSQNKKTCLMAVVRRTESSQNKKTCLMAVVRRTESSQNKKTCTMKAPALLDILGLRHHMIDHGV